MRPKAMMLTGGALATALAVAAGPAAAGAAKPRQLSAQAAASAKAPDSSAKKAPDSSAQAPDGVAFGGVTPQSWPVVVTLDRVRNRVDQVVIGLDMTCTSGDSFGTSDSFKALKLSKTGRFSKTLGPQRIDAGGVPADVESRVIGRMAINGTSVRGIWSLKITIFDPTATTVVDTCESGLVRWKARQ